MLARLDRVGFSSVIYCGFKVEPLVRSHDLFDGEQIINSDALRERAISDGYLYFPGLIPPDLILNLRQIALQLAAKAGWLEGDWQQAVANASINQLRYDDPSYIKWLEQLLPSHAFRTLGNFNAIKTILQTLFGGPVQAQCGDLCRIMSPGSGEQSTLPHQDGHYIESSKQLWTVWIPLSTCPLSLGPLAIMPGSHHHGNRTHGCSNDRCQGITVSADDIWASNDYAIGDALMFSNLTIHGGLENTSDNQVRLSADYRYQPLVNPNCTDARRSFDIA